jgi:SAM-dependent methyltransferase
MKLTEIQWILAMGFILLALQYVGYIIYDNWVLNTPTQEGFSDTNAKDKDDKEALYTWEEDPLLYYDDFYAKIYDQLTQTIAQTKAKVDLSLEVWKKDKSDPSSWTVLDAGCGTGIALCALAKQNVGNVIGIDQSSSMIRQANDVVIPQSTLSDEQKQRIQIRKDSLLNPSACSPGEVQHTICQYFTVYYLEDKEAFFRNVLLWTKQGGSFHLEVVNKHKFDPILESANPILGFSLQKYAKDRIKKSKVTFNTFEYEAEFSLIDPKAEFRETFRFKNGKVRRQKHIFTMPTSEEITKMAVSCGWKYEGYLDLISVGFEYSYTLMFKKP